MPSEMKKSHQRRAEKESELDPAIARQLFYIDPADQVPQLRWVESRGTVSAGSLAGWICSTGYRVVKIDWKQYYAHRLIFAHHHGRWPADQLDHIDGDRLNNRIQNLREVSNAENCRNQRMAISNTSGITGVTWHKVTGKWAATIRSNYRQIHIGLFKRFEDAVAARRQAEIDHGFHPNHGRKV